MTSASHAIAQSRIAVAVRTLKNVGTHVCGPFLTPHSFAFTWLTIALSPGRNSSVLTKAGSSPRESIPAVVFDLRGF